MHRQECFHLCNKHFGRVVHIHDVEGRCHIGKIIDISDDSVWIEPLTRRYNSGFGYGSRYDDGDYYGYDNYGYDYYNEGAVVELAFGFIVGIAVAALFFF